MASKEGNQEVVEQDFLLILRSALTSLETIDAKHECDGLLSLRSVVSRRTCADISVCWYITDSRASRSISCRMAELPQREVVDFQVQTSYLPLHQLRKVFRLQPLGGFPVQQARALLCDPSGGIAWCLLSSSCARAFTRLPVSTCLVRWSRLVHCVLVAAPECRSSHWARQRPSPQCGSHLRVRLTMRVCRCSHEKLECAILLVLTSQVTVRQANVKTQRCTIGRRRVDSTQARTTTSGAGKKCRLFKLSSPTHTCKPPLLSCCVFQSKTSKTVKVVFCDNLPSAAPLVRRTESAARLLSWHASSCSIPRTSHRWWHFNGFEDGLNKNVDYLSSLLTLFAVPLLCLVTISTTKSSGHDPRHSSCYVSTVWSMMLWGRLFLTGRKYSCHPSGITLWLWCHKNLCYDIRFQVTLSRLVSLAKCCSELFGCHQSASVFCCRYPLSSLGAISSR